MKKTLAVAATLACVIGITSNASALLPVYRCSFDQLMTPTDASNRRIWAQNNANANLYYTQAYGGKDYRFWDPLYTNDALIYAGQGIQVYPATSIRIATTRCGSPSRTTASLQLRPIM